MNDLQWHKKTAVCIFLHPLHSIYMIKYFDFGCCDCTGANYDDYPDSNGAQACLRCPHHHCESMCMAKLYASHTHTLQ